MKRLDRCSGVDPGWKAACTGGRDGAAETCCWTGRGSSTLLLTTEAGKCGHETKLQFLTHKTNSLKYFKKIQFKI